MVRNKLMIRNQILQLCLIAAAIPFSFAQGEPQSSNPSQPVVATLDATKVGAPISRYDYGMFIEHLGNIINHGLWSEMLDDRKFYFPVNSEPEKEPAGNPMRARFLRMKKWRPIGPDEVVVMDHEHAYVGEQSPEIKLDASTPHGIQQSGLALRKGKAYTGRIVLAASSQARISVSVVWGSGANDRQTVSILSVHATYAKFPLKFTAQSDSDEGRIEISGTGSGSFHVGAVSLMPADNVHGFRPDTTSLLRDLDSGFYRFPGGNYISGYDWRDAVGDPDKRPPMWDYAWNVMQPNDVGMDEFMDLCKILKVDPYITVNAGFGDDRSAADQVEYMNGSVHTHMGALRAANGHPEPYNVKYWNIGNEPYGNWQLGRTALRYFLMKNNAYAKAMRAVDPSIILVASGAMPDQMTVTNSARRATGKTQAEYGTDGDWTGGLLDKSWGTFEGISDHWYCYYGMRFDWDAGKDNPFLYDQNPFTKVTEPLIDTLRRPSNRVREKVEAWDEYNKRFPKMKDKKIFLAIDEWAMGGVPSPSLKIAVSYAMVMNEMFRHSDFITMGAFTFATSTIDFNATDATYNTTGLMFKMYREHYGTLPVDVTGNSPQPAPKWPVGGDQPAVNAGSPTYPLDVAAAFTADHKFLTVSVANPTTSAQPLNLIVQGIHLGGKGKLWQMTGPEDAGNLVGQKPQVEVVETALRDVPSNLSVAPFSVNIYEFSVQ
jgi:alpha-N-arabinofuranosidase